MEYYIYWDGEKPYLSPVLKRTFMMWQKPSESEIILKRRDTYRPNLTVKKARIEIIND
jgi:hypothetical protein